MGYRVKACYCCLGQFCICKLHWKSSCSLVWLTVYDHLPLISRITGYAYRTIFINYFNDIVEMQTEIAVCPNMSRPQPLCLFSEVTSNASCSLTRWQHFPAWRDIMATILNAWYCNQKSYCVNRCVFTWKTILLNFIPIRFETTMP